MNHGLQRLRTLPRSARLMRKIHERLLGGVRRHDMLEGMTGQERSRQFVYSEFIRLLHSDPG